MEEEREQPKDIVTLRLKRGHLLAGLVALGLAVGFAAGFGVAWALRTSDTVQETTASATAQQPTAQAQQQPTAQAQQQPTVQAQQPTAQPVVPSGVRISIEGRPFIGPEDAPVTIVEFSDYQCAFCGRHFRQTLPQLLREYEGKLKYVLLNYPISSIHPFAQKAGEAAECAFDQGKFWEYHDTLFQNQRALGVDSLKQYAVDLGLNTTEFDTCLDSGAKTALVLGDFQDGQRYGVTGTPTFFINGQPLVGARPFDSFKRIIDAALGG